MGRRARAPALCVLISTLVACGDSPTTPSSVPQPPAFAGLSGTWSTPGASSSSTESCTTENGITICITLTWTPAAPASTVALVIAERDGAVTGTLRVSGYLAIPIAGRLDGQTLTLSGAAEESRDSVRIEDRLTDWRAIVTGNRMSARFQMTRTTTGAGGFVTVASQAFSFELFRVAA